MTDDPRAVEVFAAHRDLVFSVACRILGTAADRSRVAEPRAYLARIVSNLAMDRLRSARARREAYVGPWLPEPILTRTSGADDAGATDVADDAVSADSVSTALLVVLESLTPLERAVFVLHEAFDFPYGDIADAVGRTEATVRQAGHRARGHVLARRPRFHADRGRQREVTRRFLAAAAGGDLTTLMELLAPDVTLWTDGGGKVRQAMRPVVGAARVASWFAGVATRPYEGVEPAGMTVELVELNGGPGIVFSGAGRVLATLTLALDEGSRITTIHNVANPDKLRAAAAGTVHDVGP